MAAVPYRVYVIVDPDFREKLAQLERGVPVWIVDSLTNKPVVQRFWNARPNESHLTGITTFHNMDALSPEDMLLRQLDTIELHHGPYSANPAYSVIEVLGTQLTPTAKNGLAEYGFDEFHITSTGFVAIRSKPFEHESFVR
jgi:hypothetical protein